MGGEDSSIHPTMEAMAGPSGSGKGIAGEPMLSMPPTGETSAPEVEFMDEDFYGSVDESAMPASFLEQNRPRIPCEIVAKKDGRYFVQQLEGKGELLKLEETLPIQVLCVAPDGVFHCRYYEEENFSTLTRDMHPASVQKMLDEIRFYYANMTNRRATSYKINSWKLVVGEVVVAFIKRIINITKGNVNGRSYYMRNEFQRATVLEIKPEGVTVQLLDDYGSGGITMDKVFKIKPIFAKRRPQVFQCELAGMEFFRWKKVVQNTVRSYPVSKTNADYYMNKFRATFHGEYSERGLPFVEIHLKQLTSPKWLSLKSYVLWNVQFSLTPFNHLLEGKPHCRVLRVDNQGNVWLQFGKDSEILERMHSAMEKLRSLYDCQRNFVSLTLENIHPKRNKDRAGRNSEGLYVALLYDKKVKKQLFFRVSILKCKRFPSDKMVRVICIDYGVERVVPAQLLIPLSSFLEDFCFIPPLAFQVHLHRIGALNINHADLKSLLFQQGELKAALVHEWPGNAYPPDVSLHLISEDVSPATADAEVVKDKIQISGLGKLLVDKRLAIEYSDEQMKLIIGQAEEYANAVRKIDDEKARRDKIEYGNGCSFLGENFQFLWPALEVAEILDDTVPQSEEETFLSQNYWHRQGQV